MNETPEGRRCAYELCQRLDPIEVIPGHRRKLYHDENCRQAQHRLLAARNVRDALSQVWVAFLPETQVFLEDVLTQHGEVWARRAITVVAAERDQAEQLSLTEDEQAALRQHWAELQPFTRNILEGLLTSRRNTLSLFNLIWLAIDKERTHAICNSELERRTAYLEITLAEYRKVIDLEDREKVRQQFIAVGQLLGYRALPKYRLGEGPDRWEDYASWTHEETLAEVIIYGREILAEEEAVKERAQEKSQLRQIERQLAQERARRKELERQYGDRAILTDQHLEAQLAKDLNAVRANVAGEDLLRTLYGQALLLVKEHEHEVQYLKTRISKQLERRLAKQQARIQELEAEQAEWVAWKEAKIVGSGDLTAMRRYLQEHLDVSIPIIRNGVTVKIVALGDDAVAVSEDHGLIRLNDDELQQGRIWVSKKVGWPMMVTRLPIGESKAEWRHWLQAEKELAAAQLESQALHRELARYLPPPRSLLECSLRLWSTRTKLFRVGDDVEAFIKEASDRRLLKEIEWAQDCYFIGKHQQRRRRIIAEAISQGAQLLYRGDPDLVFTSIDEQGKVTLSSGQQTWLDYDDSRQFWVLIVMERGQQAVGGNARIAPIQQYLCEHPGQTIPLRAGEQERQVVLVDDDQLAITTRQKWMRLDDDDIDQMQRWVKQHS